MKKFHWSIVGLVLVMALCLAVFTTGKNDPARRATEDVANGRQIEISIFVYTDFYKKEPESLQQLVDELVIADPKLIKKFRYRHSSATEPAALIYPDGRVAVLK